MPIDVGSRVRLRSEPEKRGTVVKVSGEALLVVADGDPNHYLRYDREQWEEEAQR